MKLPRLCLTIALAGLIPATAAFAGSPDIAFSAKRHGSADFKWPYDGTRDAVFVKLKRMLGAEKNMYLTGWARNEIDDTKELLRNSTLTKGVDKLTVETRTVGVDKP